MPTRLVDGQYYVQVEVAFEWKRQKLDINPVWQQKMRRVLSENDRDTP